MQEVNKPAITKKDIINAGYTGIYVDSVYNLVSDMVKCGHYQNDREFLLNKLKTLEIVDGIN